MTLPDLAKNPYWDLSTRSFMMQLDQPGSARPATQDEIKALFVELRAALEESYGSYQSLLNQLSGLAQGADFWDGPICARRALGIKEPE